MSWKTRMNEKIIQKDSCLVVGLDPMPSYFPEGIARRVDSRENRSFQ